MLKTYSYRVACLLLLLTGLIAWIAIEPSTAGARISQTPSGENYRGALFKSIDGGNSWIDITPAGGMGIPGSFAIDPATPSTIYAGIRHTGVFKSVDGGINWKQIKVGPSNADISRVVIDPLSPSTVYAAAYKEGVFKSVDGGESWSLMSAGLPQSFSGYGDIAASDLVIDAKASSTLYAAVARGVYKSTDAGLSWKATGLTKGFFSNLLVDPSNPSLLYAGGFGEIFKSEDGGSTWNSFSSGLEDSPVHALAIDPIDSSTVYAAMVSSRTVFKSTTGGQNWTANRDGLREAVTTSIIVDHKSPSLLYVTLAYNAVAYPASTSALGTSPVPGGVVKSTDGGKSWTDISAGLTTPSIYSLAIDPTNSAILYAGAERVVPALPPLRLPIVESVTASGKKLIVEGKNFDDGALILVDGRPQETKNDEANPATRLVARKGLKKIKRSDVAAVSVMNKDGQPSTPFAFKRP